MAENLNDRKKSFLALGNACFRKSEYYEAIKYYSMCSNEIIDLSSIVNFNLKFSNERLNRYKADGSLLDTVPLKDVIVIKESGLFDEAWYLQEYPQVKRLQMNPVEHYLQIGAHLGYNPSSNFNTLDYYKANPDVEKAGINPLLHYVRSGLREKRRIAPRRRAMDKLAWRKGRIPAISSVPSVLLCAHEVNENLFGGERSFIDVLEAISQMNVNVYITVPNEDNADYIDLLLKKSCGLYSFPYGLWSKGRGVDETTINDFLYILDQQNISLVYCNTIVHVEPLLAARNAGRLTVTHARELIDHDEHLCNRIGQDAQSIIDNVLQKSDYIIANSAKTQSLFIHSCRCYYVPNVANVDLLDVPNLVEDKVVFGIISSNVPKKGIGEFVEIARRAEKLVPKAKFCVIGPENSYITELQNSGISSNIEFTGYVSSPVEALKKVNVVLSLSNFAESFGRTVAEAQAARRPVIAYRWGAVPELIDEGKTGFLVEHKNIDSVLAKINIFCKKPKLIPSMGEVGRNKILRGYSPIVLRNNLRYALSSILNKPVTLRVDDTRHLTIIIPVFNAPDAVERCLKSVLAHTNLTKCRILIINDGSTDKRIKPLLELFSYNPGFNLLVNHKNIGYTCTINRGTTWAGDDDILLLNSDTIVHDGWIEGMRKVALGSPKAGTVTAMGDNSGAFSFPQQNVVNPKPEDISYDAWAKRIIGFTQILDPIEVPTGNGFCLYIRRDLISHIGLFDEKAFPRGYGEENDFCMRALKAGWKNLISPHAYIFHQRTASFGAEKQGLINTAMDVINQRYPDYGRKVKAAFNSHEMKKLRELAQKAYDESLVSSALKITETIKDKPDTGFASRFISLNKTMIDWKKLQGEVHKRDPYLISIIICVYNQYTLTNKCFQALERHCENLNIEFIVVNNASNKEMSTLLDSWAEHDKRFNVIHNFDNLNFSLGNNIGFAASKGAKVVFLNNDTEVQKGWLEPMVASLDNPDVVGVQPKLIYPDGLVQCIGVVFSGKTPLGYPIYVDQHSESPWVSKNRRFRAITGACLAVRADDFVSVGGFDPVFINGQEDIDFCYRLGHGKYVFEYVSSALVVHHEGRTKGRGKFNNYNRHTFVKRWCGAFPGDDIDYYIKDNFVVSNYLSDRTEMDEQRIACWRAEISA